MLCILVSMRELASITPIAGARGALGMTLQCLAGAVGGAVFGISISQFSRTPEPKKNDSCSPDYS